MNLSLKEGGCGSLYPWRVAYPGQIRMQQTDADTSRLQCPTDNTIIQGTVMTPDLTGTNKYLSNRVKRYQGIWVESMEGTKNLYRRLARKPVYMPTQATPKS
jgi:hypothetical protein